MLVPVMGIRDLGAVRCDGNGIPPIRTQRMHGVNKILENLCIFAKKKKKKKKIARALDLESMWKYLFVYVYPQCNVGGLRGDLGGGEKGARYEGSKTGPKKMSEREKEKGRDTSTVRLELCILHLS